MKQVKRCKCGLYVGGTVCQCKINQIRREMRDGDNMLLALKCADRRELKRAGMVAEVAYCGE
jgi:hypothetical protein